MYDAIVHDLIAFSLQNGAGYGAEFKHYGVGHLNGGHSGRYPYGSGGRPYQHDKRAREQHLKAKHASSGNIHETKSNRRGKRNATISDLVIIPTTTIARTGGVLAVAAGTAWGAQTVLPTAIALGTVSVAEHLKNEINDVEINRRRKNLTKDEETGFYLKDKNAKSTPGYDAYWSNKHSHFSTDGTKCNGALAAMAYDLRRRGYEVTAMPLYAQLGKKQFRQFYPNGKFEKIANEIAMSNKYITAKEGKQSIAAGLEKYPVGARGLLRVNNSLGGVHDYIFERTYQNDPYAVSHPLAGAVKELTNTTPNRFSLDTGIREKPSPNARACTLVMDATGTKMYNLNDPKAVDRAFRLVKDAEVMRLDNIEPNMKKMHEVCY